MGYKVGVDTGGTFTDITLINDDTGRMSVAKVPSTPDNPAVGVIEGIRTIAEQAGVSFPEIGFLIHGTTVATNALLENKGARTALITTKGFRDVLHIARQTRPKLYDFQAKRPAPLVVRRLRFEAPERVSHTGKIIKPLDGAAIEDISRVLGEEAVESVAICLLHSYANPSHEELIKGIVSREHPGVFVTLSSEVLPEFREYERMSTITINAYVMPMVNRYVSLLAEEIGQMGVKSGLYIMQSNGGVITSEAAREASARTVLSGPAGGALAGGFLCRQTDTDNLISVDMGGTSLDICLLENRTPRYTTESEIGGYPIKLPMIDIHTIGAGGGSLAWIDAGGALRVGPESAGAVPGPVCYQKGGVQPTVTDANVVLGRISPEYILGGRMKMDAVGASRVIKEKIADPLGLSVEEAAAGILRVVNANMVRGIRVVSVESGYDPRDFALAAFGGAGPVHACDLARELLMDKVIVPPHPGITSAMGMLTADVRHDYVQTHVTTMDKADPGGLGTMFAGLESEAVRQLAEEGFEEKDMVLLRSVDLRYAGQAFELAVSLPAGELGRSVLQSVEERFHASHLKQYGYQRRDGSVELVNLRLVALGKLPGLRVEKAPGAARVRAEPVARRRVYFDNGYVDTPVFDRARLAPGFDVTGPAVVEQLDSTTLVLPGQLAGMDEFGNIVVKVAGGERC